MSLRERGIHYSSDILEEYTIVVTSCVFFLERGIHYITQAFVSNFNLRTGVRITGCMACGGCRYIVVIFCVNFNSYHSLPSSYHSLPSSTNQREFIIITFFNFTSYHRITCPVLINDATYNNDIIIFTSYHRITKIKQSQKFTGIL